MSERNLSILNYIMDILVCTTANTFTVYNRVVILKNVSMIFYASDVLLSL